MVQLLKKLNQEKKPNVTKNAYVEPSKQILDGINQEMQDVNQSVITNVAKLKKSIQQAKLNQFRDFKNETIADLKDIQQDILEAEKWNGLKNNTIDTFETIGTKTMDEIKYANENLAKAGKSAFRKSSKAISQSKDFLSESAPKVSKTVGNSLKSLFRGNQSLSQKDLDLLDRLAKLKESGILTQKEFNAKKKKILDKI